MALYIDNRYLNSRDNEFVELVSSDVSNFLNASAKNEKLVLVFPPVSSYHRFLIHKSVEGFPSLCSFSIGEGEHRRPVVCLEEAVMQNILTVESTETRLETVCGNQEIDETPAKELNTSSLSSSENKQSTSAPCSVIEKTRPKRKQSHPPLQVYVPPRKRSQEANNEQNVDIKPGAEAMSENISLSPRIRNDDENDDDNLHNTSDVVTETATDSELQKPTEPVTVTPVKQTSQACDVSKTSPFEDHTNSETTVVFDGPRTAPSCEDHRNLRTETLSVETCKISLLEGHSMVRAESVPVGVHTNSQTETMLDDASKTSSLEGHTNVQTETLPEDLGECQGCQRADGSNSQSVSVEEKCESRIEQDGTCDHNAESDDVSPVEMTVAAGDCHLDTDTNTTLTAAKDTKTVGSVDVISVFEECIPLPPELMKELEIAVGKINIIKPQSDYKRYLVDDLDTLPEGSLRLIEIHNIPEEMKTRDLLPLFRKFHDKHFDIKWVDDTRAIGIFSTVETAERVVSEFRHPALKVQRLKSASAQTKLVAKGCPELFEPYKPRPETTVAAAKNMVSGALGIRRQVLDHDGEETCELRKTRDGKRELGKGKRKIWDGKIRPCAMDLE